MKKEKFNAFLLAIVAMAAVFAFVSVVYAAFSTTLTINGSAVVKAAKWDVHFTNLSALSGTNTKGFTYAAPQADPNVNPTLTAATTISGFKAVLTQPGDEVSFTVDIENTGSLNARLTSITLPTLTCTPTGTVGQDGYTQEMFDADKATCEAHVAISVTGVTENTTVINAGSHETVTVKVSLYSDYAGGNYTLNKDVTVGISQTSFVFTQA